MSRIGLLLLLLSLASGGGCAGSRWARADPKYRRKYDHHTEDPVRTVKQAVDARHVAGRDGWYLAGGGGDRNGEASVGYFNYAEPLGGAVEGYVGLRGLLTPSSGGDLAGGLEGGIRLQAPSRVAPFVGLGVFGGYALSSVEGADGETRSALAGGLSPEVGVHTWLTPRCRLTASAKHTLFAVEGGSGREEDYTTLGLAISFLDVPGYGENRSATPLACGEALTTVLPQSQRESEEPARSPAGLPYAHLIESTDSPSAPSDGG